MSTNTIFNPANLAPRQLKVLNQMSTEEIEKYLEEVRRQAAVTNIKEALDMDSQPVQALMSAFGEHRRLKEAVTNTRKALTEAKAALESYEEHQGGNDEAVKAFRASDQHDATVNAYRLAASIDRGRVDYEDLAAWLAVGAPGEWQSEGQKRKAKAEKAKAEKASQNGAGK